MRYEVYRKKLSLSHVVLFYITVVRLVFPATECHGQRRVRQRSDRGLHFDGAIPPTANDLVCDKVHAVHLVGVTGKIRFDFVSFQIPHLDDVSTSLPSRKTGNAYLERTVLARAHKQSGICAPRQPVHSTDVPAQSSDELAGPTLPYPHAVIPRSARRPSSVRAECNVRYLSLMASETRKRLQFSRGRRCRRRRFVGE